MFCVLFIDFSMLFVLCGMVAFETEDLPYRAVFNISVAVTPLRIMCLMLHKRALNGSGMGWLVENYLMKTRVGGNVITQI